MTEEGIPPSPAGAHVSKGYDRPFDPFSTIARFTSTKRARSNLPAPPTRLVDRERELGAVCDLLTHDDVRLLTLTGPGGVGKTRLGVEAAANIKDRFTDGVFFIPLSSTTDPSLLVSAIAQTLGLREEGQRPLIESVKDYLHEKNLLLFLDTFEHLLAGATTLAELLAYCEKLKMLVTSREVLRVRGEREFPTPPLPLPNTKKPSADILELSQNPAVTLFTQRALDARPDFALTNENSGAVAEICIRLDGLPLALELAAARIGVLPPQGILERLTERFKLLGMAPRDLPARQQSLRAAIDSSYDLLEDSEKKLFRHLSVFTDGCTLEAAEKVCNPSRDLGMEVLDGLASLVQKNLVRREEVNGQLRFSMLETIHEYALEQLVKSGEEDEVRLYHWEFFLNMAESAEGQLWRRVYRPEQVVWLNRLETEYGNLRGALQWSQQKGQLDKVLRLSGTLRKFWSARGHREEGRQWLDSSLQNDRITSVPQPILAKALSASGGLALGPGQFAAARSNFERSLETYKKLADRHGEARVLSDMGYLAAFTEGVEQASTLFAKSLEIHRELGDKEDVADCLYDMGVWTIFRGDLAGARSLLEQSLAIVRELGERPLPGLLRQLAEVISAQGDYSAARELCEEALAATTDLGDTREMGMAVLSIGNLASGQGDFAEAHQLLEKGNAIFRELGSKDSIALSLFLLGQNASSSGDLEGARSFYEEALSKSKASGTKLNTANILRSLGRNCLLRRDFERARLFSEESLQLSLEMGSKMQNASATLLLGQIAARQGEYSSGWKLLEEGLAKYKGMKLKENVTNSLGVMGEIARRHGDYDKAATLFHEALSSARELGDKSSIADLLYQLARVALAQNDHTNALAFHRESLVLRNQMGVKHDIAKSLEGLAELALAQRQPERAARLLAAADALRERIGLRLIPIDLEEHQQVLTKTREGMSHDDFAAAWASGHAMSLDEAVSYALATNA